MNNEGSKKRKNARVDPATAAELKALLGIPPLDGMGKAMERISGKWKLWILWAMRSGTKLRFSEIKHQIFGINDVMLSQSLKDLTACGLVNRTEKGEQPTRVYYQLTKSGKGILPALEALAAWGEELK